jgi:endonuclease-3
MATRKKSQSTSSGPSAAHRKSDGRASSKRAAATQSGANGASERNKRASEVRKRLARAMPTGRPELDHAGPWQLLIATILSAQSTDRMVNKVTPVLFEQYPTPGALAEANREDVERIVKPTGFYRNKTKSICEVSRALVERHDGEVPRTMEEMVELPGVARKTANVVLGAAYGIASGIVVDTHAKRVAGRLGLTEETKPDKIEQDLCGVFPKSSWIDMGHRLVLHGRYVCKSKTPECPHCPLNEVCPSAEAEPEGKWTARADAEHARIMPSD